MDHWIHILKISLTIGKFPFCNLLLFWGKVALAPIDGNLFSMSMLVGDKILNDSIG